MWVNLANKELGYSLFILTNFNDFSCLNLLSVIIHEYGYFIHDIYFHNQSFPITDSTRENSVEENQEKIAIAFEEYIMGKISTDSKRYKRIKSILVSL